MAEGRAPEPTITLFVWLISHQPAVRFSQNKPATSNQPAVLFSHNKSAPAINHQPNEQAASFPISILLLTHKTDYQSSRSRQQDEREGTYPNHNRAGRADYSYTFHFLSFLYKYNNIVTTTTTVARVIRHK
jgi:hypothetical protein